MAPAKSTRCLSVKSDVPFTFYSVPNVSATLRQVRGVSILALNHQDIPPLFAVGDPKGERPVVAAPKSAL